MTVNIPSAIQADVIAALKSQLGDESDGLTDNQLFVEWVRRQLSPALNSYRRKRLDTSALDNARDAAQTALNAQQGAYETAINVVGTAIDTDLAQLA
jgi:hypothetical protein